MKTLTKLPKLHLVCSKEEVRPIFNYILVTKNETVATNTMAIVVHDSIKLFGDKFVEEMPDRFLIHFKHWSIISKGFKCIKFKNGVIEVYKDGIKYIYPINYESEISLFPNYNKIFDDLKDQEQLFEIGIDAKLLFDVQEALYYPGELKSLHMKFFGLTRAIIINQNYGSSFHAKGLIMPTMII